MCWNTSGNVIPFLFQLLKQIYLLYKGDSFIDVELAVQGN